MTALLLNEFKQKIKGYRLIPDKGGCFELKVNGDLVYSKLATGEFPKEQAMLDEVRRRAK